MLIKYNKEKWEINLRIAAKQEAIQGPINVVEDVRN